MSLTLGRLIEVLEALPSETPLVNVGPFVHSYRGYYADLAIEPGPGSSIGALLETLRGIRGVTLTGYKGGEFVMGDATPLWFATYGQVSDLAVTGVAFDAPDSAFLLAHEVSR